MFKLFTMPEYIVTKATLSFSRIIESSKEACTKRFLLS